jgi:Sulfotransferase family
MGVKVQHNILMHYHIFGNAGEFVDLCLQACLGDSWVKLNGDPESGGNVSAQALKQLIANRADLVAVSSMLSHPPLPDSMVKPIILVADPIVRAKEVFDRVVTDETQPNSAIARDRGFKGYIQWLLDGGEGGVVIRNYQVLHLSSAASRYDNNLLFAKASEQDLLEATQLIHGAEYVGLVDRPICSIRLLLRQFARDFGCYLSDSFLEHFSARVKYPVQKLREQIRLELGDVLYAELVESNRLDIQLYEHSRQKFLALLGPNCSSQGYAGTECHCAVSGPVAEPAIRPLFFMHIPKTAGSAFSLHLKNHFNFEDICPAVFWPDFLRIPQVRRGSYKLIAAHLSDDANWYLNVRPIYITVLRDPVERVLSFFHYQKYLSTERRQVFSDESMNQRARKLWDELSANGVEFVLRSADPGMIRSISNLQTRTILGDMMNMPEILTDAHLEDAKTKLRGYAFVGITERMQQSLDLLSYTFGWAPMENVRVNETPEGAFRQDVSAEAVSMIREMNQRDIELYGFAKGLFEERLAAMLDHIALGCAATDADGYSQYADNVKAGLHQHYMERYRATAPPAVTMFSGKLNFGPVGRGWYEWNKVRDGGHRWTGPGVVSTLDLPVEKYNDLVISIRLVAYASEDVLDSARIGVDGHWLDTKRTHGRAGDLYLRAFAPRSLLEQAIPFLRIEIKVNRTVSSREVNPSAMTKRMLGIAVHSIDVRPRLNTETREDEGGR